MNNFIFKEMSSGKDLKFTYSRTLLVSGDRAYSTQDPSYSKTNFTINLGTNLQGVSRVSFINATFPNNAYNVNTGQEQNNTFSVQVNASEDDYIASPGFYTTTTAMAVMVSAISATLAAAGHGQTIAITQDSTSNLVQVTYGQGSSTFPSMSIMQTPGAGAGMWDLLGFNVAAGPIILPTGVPVIATYLPSLGGLKMAYLQSGALAPGTAWDSNGDQKNYCLGIPIEAAFGVSNIWECRVDNLCEITYPTKRNLQLIDFALVDKDGHVIDLHGGNLQLTMKIWFDRY